MQPFMFLLYVVLFTTAPGSFSGFGCKPMDHNSLELRREMIEQAVEKKAGLPIMNPLQILSSKYL